MTIKFLGAAGIVTGSKYLIETISKKLMVDCGVFQGLKEFRLLNWSGKRLPFNMHIEHIEGLSAHGDQNDLIDWLSEIKESPEKLFIIHGETKQSEALKQRIQETYHWDSEIPRLGTREEIIT